jgi:hypothetical protein
MKKSSRLAGVRLERAYGSGHDPARWRESESRLFQG